MEQTALDKDSRLVNFIRCQTFSLSKILSEGNGYGRYTQRHNIMHYEKRRAMSDFDQITEQELNQIVSYLKSLQKKKNGGRDEN